MLPPPQRVGDNTHGSGLLPRPEYFDVLNHLLESMEISKSLKEEILDVQQELQKAILEHQMCVENLKDDPNNSDILGQIKKIQIHIKSLGKCQKQFVQRLRKEVDAFKANNANGSKVSIPFLLGLNNNNHITNNNETKHEATANGFGTKPSKENYEKVVRNGDVHHSHPRDNDYAKLRPSSVETVSGEDDVIEVPLDENSDITQENVQKEKMQTKEIQMKEIQQEKVQIKEEQMKEVQMKEVQMKEVQKEEMQKEEVQKEEMQKEIKKEEVEIKEEQMKEGQKEHIKFTHSTEKCYYLNCLGLITKSKFIELQNRRVERKRRSTANPHFVYSMLEQPSKRRRYSYLSGNPPHTRQTTARMNGPSLPLNKSQPIKPTSPSEQTKPLIPVQKSTTRPNILRNAESKVFVNKSKVEDNQTRLSVSSAKSVQSVGSKAVHIPGLPSSLTIERIGSDSIVCICCKNPGSLTSCKNCSSNYHVSCHTRPAPPSRICPKCISVIKEEENIEKDEEEEELEGENKFHYKKDEKYATTANASGFIGQAREDSEIYKASGGLYKVDATQNNKHVLPTVFGVNQLPASTFLIPITTNNIFATNVNQSEDSKFFDTEYRVQDTAHRNHHVISHHLRPTIAYVQEDQVSHSYQLPSTIQPEKHQSYLIVKKIAESTGRSNQSPGGETEDQNHSAVFNYQLPTSCSTTIQSAVLQPVVTHSLFYDRDNNKKQTNRAVPLHVTISKLSNSLHSISNDHQLDRATLNGRKPWAKLTRGKLCVNQSARSATEILLSSYGDSENSITEQQRPRSAGSAEKATATANLCREKYRSRNFIHSLFPGHNKSHTVTSRARESRSPNDRDCPLLRQQLCREEHELGLHEQPDSKPAAVQLQRRALTRFFEHVKLEEAHISAPFRTKLAHKDEISDNDDDEIAREDSPCDEQYDNDGAVAEASLLTSCDILDEDRLIIPVPWLDADSKNACDDIANKVSVRRLSDAALSQSNDYTGYELVRINSRSSVTLRHLVEREDDRPTIAAAAATLRIAQSNLSELCNEVSVPDDKADTERQDLPSGRQLRSRSNSSSSSSSSSNSSSNSNSSSSGHSDTPEQAMNVNDLSDDFNILAKMGFVSPGGNDEEQVDDESATESETDAATD
ncbi:PF21A protein, partial [Pseudoatta argentina]